MHYNIGISISLQPNGNSCQMLEEVNIGLLENVLGINVFILEVVIYSPYALCLHQLASDGP